MKECVGNFAVGALADFNACLKVCTKRSAARLVAGWYRAPVRWTIPSFSLQNSWNSSVLKVEAQSVTTVLGKPKCAKSSCGSLIADFADTDCVAWMQGYLVQASVTTSQSNPRKLTAWLIRRRLHDLSGNIHGWTAAFDGSDWCPAQVEHCRHRSRTSESMFGR